MPFGNLPTEHTSGSQLCRALVSEVYFAGYSESIDERIDPGLLEEIYSGTSNDPAELRFSTALNM